MALEGARVEGAAGAAVFLLRPSLEHRAVPRGRPSRRHHADLFPQPRFDPGLPLASRSLAVTGESGTGRTTYADAAVAGMPAQRLDIPTLAASGRSPDLPAVVAAAQAGDAVVVIDGAELLTDRDLLVLRRLVTERTIPIVLVTDSTVEHRPVLAAVTSLCDEAITLPPLRYRAHLIAAYAAFFAADARRRRSCSAAVIDALTAHDWPANLAELRRVIDRAGAHAEARGSHVHLDLVDLPERYRLSSKAAALTVRERAERQAIVDALASCSGNKVHAARHLGISRSTLYARIRALGVDV